MKQALLAVAFCISLFSCTKEDLSPEKISGTWTIVESHDVSTGYIQVQHYTPSSEISLEFKADGTLFRTGANPGTAMSPLWEYDKYQLLEKNIIRLYQSFGTKEVRVYYEIENGLFLNYIDTRHPYEERFLRVR